MNLRLSIHQWLGLDVIRRSQSINASAIAGLHNKLDIQNLALARVIAKLDPNYARSEFDPTRRAESDDIGRAVIARLEAEAKASWRP